MKDKKIEAQSKQNFFTGLEIQKKAFHFSLSLFPWENPKHSMYFRRLNKKGA